MIAQKQLRNMHAFHLLADATVGSVIVTMNVTIPLYASSPYVRCPSSAQASLLNVGVDAGVDVWCCMLSIKCIWVD